MSFTQSINTEVTETLTEYLEVGLDSNLGEGLLKDIPIIRTAVTVYKIGHTLWERDKIHKLGIFLEEINQNVADEDKREEYLTHFKNMDNKARNKELEYIMIILGHFISNDKPKMLAKLYCAYLQGLINWEMFTTYSEVINRLLPTDYKVLKSGEKMEMSDNFTGRDSFLRLMSLGLIAEKPRYENWIDDGNGTLSVSHPDTIEYSLTAFGIKLINILK